MNACCPTHIITPPLPPSLLAEGSVASPAHFVQGPTLTACFYDTLNAAADHVLIASPFVYLSHRTAKCIRKAVQRGVTCYILCRFKELDEQRVTQLARLGVHYIDVPLLHAKMLVTDAGALVSSANLTWHSEQKTLEAGSWYPPRVLGHREATEYLESLATGGNVVDRSGLSSAVDRARSTRGHCIGCKKRNRFDALRPYCKQCYWQWHNSGRPHRVERFCHATGQRAKTTFQNPIAAAR